MLLLNSCAGINSLLMEGWIDLSELGIPRWDKRPYPNLVTLGNARRPREQIFDRTQQRINAHRRDGFVPSITHVRDVARVQPRAQFASIPLTERKVHHRCR